jgi:hypothetical protein
MAKLDLQQEKRNTATLNLQLMCRPAVNPAGVGLADRQQTARESERVETRTKERKACNYIARFAPWAKTEPTTGHCDPPRRMNWRRRSHIHGSTRSGRRRATTQ